MVEARFSSTRIGGSFRGSGSLRVLLQVADSVLNPKQLWPVMQLPAPAYSGVFLGDGVRGEAVSRTSKKKTRTSSDHGGLRRIEWSIGLEIAVMSASRMSISVYMLLGSCDARMQSARVRCQEESETRVRNAKRDEKTMKFQ